MDLADVDAAEFEPPFLGFRADLRADGLGHFVAALEHGRELHVAQAADGGIAHVGGERTAGVGIFEQVGDRVADPHFAPDPDAHRRAFLAVHRLAAQVDLVEPAVEDVAFPQPVHDRRGQPELDPKKVKPGLIEHGQHFSEKHIDMAGPFFHDRVEPEQAEDELDRGHEEKHAEKREDGGDEEVHRGSSRITRLAFRKSESLTFRR